MTILQKLKCSLKGGNLEAFYRQLSDQELERRKKFNWKVYVPLLVAWIILLVMTLKDFLEPEMWVIQSSILASTYLGFYSDHERKKKIINKILEERRKD